MAAGNTRPDKLIQSADTVLLSKANPSSSAAKSALVAAAAETSVFVDNYRAG